MSSPWDELVSQRLNEFAASSAALASEESIERIRAAGEALVDCYRGGGKAIICGNGGSATQATHIAAEMVGRYLIDRAPLPAISLPSNEASMSAIANDYGYDLTFVRQVEGFVQRGDVVIGLTTSGRSPNVISALRVARERGAVTIGFGGRTGGDLPDVCDHLLLVPSDDTPRIQEAHLFFGHTLCEMIELALFAA